MEINLITKQWAALGDKNKKKSVAERGTDQITEYIKAVITKIIHRFVNFAPKQSSKSVFPACFTTLRLH